MLRRIKAWWKAYKRECVGVTLVRYYEFKSKEITEQVVDDLTILVKQVNYYPATTDVLIEAYRTALRRKVSLNLTDLEILPAIIKALEYLYLQDCLIWPESILFLLREGAERRGFQKLAEHFNRTGKKYR